MRVAFADIRTVDRSVITWSLVAILAGAMIALLPLPLAIGALAVAVLAVASLIDVRMALMILFTAAPLKALIETEVPGALNWPLDIGQALFVAVVALWAMRSIAQRRRLDLAWSPVFVPIILLIISVSFSVWTTLSFQRTIKELVIWLAILTMSVIVVSITKRGGIGYVVAALIVGAVVQMGIGLYEFLGGSGAPHLWILDYRYFRAFGSFGQPNPFGAFMGLTLPLALGATFGLATGAWNQYQESRKLKSVGSRYDSARRNAVIMSGSVLLAGAGSALLGVGLAISWSRGAWIGFAAAFAVMCVFAPRRRLIGFGLAAVILLGGVIAIGTGLAPQSIVNRFSDFTRDLTGFTDVRGQVISDENYAVLERFAHWQAALAMATDSPWTGIGFGAYEVAYPRYPLMNWPFALGHAHNYYMNILAETGIIGLVGYASAWIAILLLTLRALNRHTGWRRGVALGLLGVWTHLLVHSVFDKLYVNNLFLHVGAMLGLIGTLLLADKVSPSASPNDQTQA